MKSDELRKVLEDGLAQDLLKSNLTARLAYIGLDGAPRVIPIWFVWTGERVVFGTPVNAPKVKALQQSGKVALTIDRDTIPGEMILLRGNARVEIVEGPAQEYLDAGTKYLGAEGGKQFAAEARKNYAQMARILIEPTWAKLIDFKTHLPSAMEGKE